MTNAGIDQAVRLDVEWSVQTEMQADDYSIFCDSTQLEQKPFDELNAIMSRYGRFGRQSQPQETTLGRALTEWFSRWLGIEVSNWAIPRGDHKSEIADGLIGSFIAIYFDSSSSSEMDETAQRVKDFPIPVFGSPPHSWETIRSLMAAGGAGATVAVGFTGSARPVMVIVSGVAISVFWFAKPHTVAIRDYSVARLSNRLERRMKQADIQAMLEAVPDSAEAYFSVGVGGVEVQPGFADIAPPPELAPDDLDD